MKLSRIQLSQHVQLQGLKNSSTEVLNDVEATFTQHGIVVPYDAPADQGKPARAMEVLIPWGAIRYVTREREAKPAKVEKAA